MRHIAIVATAAKFGGSQSIIEDFINYVSNIESHDMSFYFFIGYKRNQNNEQRSNINFIYYPTGTNFNRFFFDIFGIKKFERLNNLRFDNLISFQNNGISCRCSRDQLIYFHNPIAFSTNKIPLENFRTIFLKFFYVLYFKFMLRSNYKIFVQLEFVKKDLQTFGVKNKIYVIPPRLKALDIGKKNLKKRDEFNLIYPATPYKYKNHKILFEAMHILKTISSANHKKIHLYLTAMDEDSTFTFSKLVEIYGLQGDVTLLGRIPNFELITLYENCDCLVFPSLLETYGIPLYDAAVAGIPIIAADLPYAKDVLKDYTCKYFVSPRNSNAWAEAIYSLCSKEDRICPPLNIMENSSWDLLLAEL